MAKRGKDPLKYQRMLAFFLLSCGGSKDLRGTLDDCSQNLPLRDVHVWCDQGHPVAAYCHDSPQPDYCVAVKQGDHGDALYCCDPAGLR